MHCATYKGFMRSYVNRTTLAMVMLCIAWTLPVAAYSSTGAQQDINCDSNMVASRKLSRKQARTILSERKGIRDLDIEQRYPVCRYFEVYLLDNGEVLMVDRSDGTGNLYDNKAALEYNLAAVQKSACESKAPRHILKDVFPYDESFPAVIPHLLDELNERLHVDSLVLDKSLESLKKLSILIQEFGLRKALNELYPHLVAYIGEVLIYESAGCWEMRRAELDSSIWEPYVLAKNSVVMNPYGKLRGVLYEDHKPLDLWLVAWYELSRDAIMKDLLGE